MPEGLFKKMHPSAGILFTFVGNFKLCPDLAKEY